MEQDFEQKLEAILSNPDMMRSIQSMAQSLGQTGSASVSGGNPPVSSGLDLSMLQKLGSLAGQTGIDKNQQSLLCAMTPYLSGAKVQKLEKAMRAAKIARVASGFLGNGGLELLTGRSNHV